MLRRSIGFISTLILVRMLPPSDFGLVAMASVLLLMAQSLTEFGFDVALIKKQDATRIDYDTAWTIKALLGIASALALVALSWPAADFYDEPRIVPIVIALSIGMVAKGFENIGIVNFRKEFRYAQEFRFFTAIKFAAFIVTVTAAYLLRSYWALVIGMIAARVTGLILSYTLDSYRPRFSIAARKELFSFSIWLYLNNILWFLRTRGADFVVGKMLGPKSLGLFSIGSEIASLPTTEIITPINRAIFPGYTKIAGDLSRLRAAYINVFAMIALLALPSASGIAVISDLAIPFLLGNNWIEAIPIVEVLAFVGLFTSLQANTAAVLTSLGKPQINVLVQSLSAAVLVPSAVILALEYGIIGVAFAYFLANGMAFVINVALSVRFLRLRSSRLMNSAIRPLVASATMYAAVSNLKGAIIGELPAALSLFSCIVFGMAVYIGTVLILWRISGRADGAESFVLNHTKSVPGLRSISARLHTETK